jgi:hypothetical protein
LTYRSFPTILAELDTARTLVQFPVSFDPDESDVRDLWMPPKMVEDLLKKDSTRAAEFPQALKGFLKRFIIGKPIDNCQYMKSWKLDIFELRVINMPRGSRWRIFGGFGDLNKFVAFNHKPRSHFGGREDPRWNIEVQKAADRWEDHFPGCHRMRSRPFSNCATNADDIPVGECL